MAPYDDTVVAKYHQENSSIHFVTWHAQNEGVSDYEDKRQEA